MQQQQSIFIGWNCFVCGGYAGWTRGLHLLRDHHDFPVQSIAIEYDIRIAHNLAVSMGIPLIDGTRPILQTAFRGMQSDCVIHADITQKCWRPAIADWKPHAISVSAPCQPWSQAGAGAGLNSYDGMAAAEAIALCKFFRPQFIFYETVAGFLSHDHHQKILLQFAWAGYKIRWSKLIDCGDCLPTTRIRWLALLYRVADDQLTFPPFQFWKPSPMCPVDFDAILDEFDTDMSLQLTDEIKQLAAKHEFLPPGQKSNTSVADVLQSRSHDGTKKLPTFMASYGSQHCLDEHTLRKKGFLAHFYQPQDQPLRYWHPCEIMALHGAYGCHFVVGDRKRAFQVLGNQITVHHALLLIVDGLRMLPRWEPKLDLHEVLTTLDRHRIRCSQCFGLETRTGQFYSADPIFLTESQICAIDSFEQSLEAERLPPGHCWTFDGLLPWTCGPVTGNPPVDVPPAQPFHYPTPELSHACDTDSQITQLDSGEISPTLSFTPILMGKIVTHGGELKFWFQGTLPIQSILATWGFQYQIENAELELGCSMQLTPALSTSAIHAFVPEPVFCLFQDNRLTLMHSDDDSFGTASQQHGFALFDQFAQLASHPMTLQVVHPGSEIGARRTSTVDAAFFLATSRFCQCTSNWDPSTHSLILHFQGPTEATVLLANIWKTILSLETLEQCGYVAEVACVGDGHSGTFSPIGDKCPVPIFAFKVQLVVNAFRSFASGFEGPGPTILLKWLGRPLYFASVPSSTSLGTFHELFGCVVLPFASGIRFNFIHKGRRATQEFDIADFVEDQSSAVLTFHLTPELVGGGPSTTTTKSGHRIQIKNSIASTLLEEGFDLKWVSDSVETLIEKQGMKQATTVSAMSQGPAKLKEVKALLESCSIRVPNIKPALSSTHALQAKSRRKVILPDPGDYRIKPGFLFNHDGSDACQLNDFGGHLSGIMLCSPDFSTPWLRDGRKISADELALAVVGEPWVDTILDARKITIPCVDPENREVLLACTLIQFGDKSLLPKVSDSHKVVQVGCSLVAITLWKADWGDEWGKITQNPYFFVRQQINSDDVVTVWGKSFRQARMPCSPSVATSIQIHCAVKDSSLTDILRASGYNKLWMTPKNQQGRPCDRWKLIWLPSDTDLSQCRVIAATAPGIAGVARSKDRFALRVEKAHFAAAWVVVHPGTTPPKDIATTKVFKVESLPFGAAADVVQSWAEQFQWPVRPLRAIGPTSWIVGCAEGPKPGQLTFNGNPVLVRELPPKNTPSMHPVVAGPRPVQGNAKRDDTQNTFALSSDPWANYTGPKVGPPSLPPRSLQGPHEAKLQAQDDRIAKLEQSLEKVTEQQVSQDAKLSQFQQDVRNQDAAIRSHIDTRLQQVKQELDTSFSAALQQQSQQFDDNMRDLKQLLGAVSKRKASAEAPNEDAEM